LQICEDVSGVTHVQCELSGKLFERHFANDMIQRLLRRLLGMLGYVMEKKSDGGEPSDERVGLKD
jgi:hypothetical protein